MTKGTPTLTEGWSGIRSGAKLRYRDLIPIITPFKKVEFLEKNSVFRKAF